MIRGATLVAAMMTVPVLVFPTSPPPHVPTLVVVVTVDQMRGDYLDRYASQYTGAFARFRRSGAVFLQADQDHGIPETAPGHSTILSGRTPASTGIVRNSEGVRDTSSHTVEVADSGASPARFRGTALIDWMRARWPEARALSVSRKDRAAILPLGRSHDALALWYAQGVFTTSRWYADSLPDWVRAVNREMPAARAPGRVWDLLLDPSRYHEPDSMAYENSGRDFVFPHRLPSDSASAARNFTEYPWMDSVTLAAALRGVHAMRLGTRGVPDLLHIGLSSTDAVGHRYGPDSRELHDQLLRVDRWLGTFLDSLARVVPSAQTVVVLTADHGVSSFPEWARAHGHPTYDYVNVDTVLDRYRRAIRAAASDPALQPFPYREYGLVTLDRPRLAAHHLDGDSIAEALRADLARVPGVLRVDTRRTIAGADTATDWIARRWQKMLPPELDAGVLITLQPGMVYSSSTLNAKHGMMDEEGSHVTLAFLGRPFRPGRYARRAATVDIGPTLATVLGIEPTEPVQGRVLREAVR